MTTRSLRAAIAAIVACLLAVGGTAGVAGAQEADTDGADTDGADTDGAGTEGDRVAGTVLVEPATEPTVVLNDPRIVESSGLALSGQRDDVAWTVNDRDNEPLVFAVSLATGDTVATVRPMGVELVDWEDLASGPGVDGQPSLWVADTGSAGGERTEATLHVVAEPVLPDDVVDGTAAPLDLEVAPTSVPVAYPDGSRNVEALLVTPSGQVTLVSKEPGREPAHVYAAPPELRSDAPNELRLVGELDLAEPLAPTADGGPPPNGRFLVTGGAVAPDGRAAVLRTYGDVLVWPLEPGQQPADVLTTTTPTRFLLPLTEQGEGVTFAAGGRDLVTSSEGREAPVFDVAMPPEAGLAPFTEAPEGTRVAIAGTAPSTDEGPTDEDGAAGAESAESTDPSAAELLDGGAEQGSSQPTAGTLVLLFGVLVVAVVLFVFLRPRRPTEDG